RLGVSVFRIICGRIKDTEPLPVNDSTRHDRTYSVVLPGDHCAPLTRSGWLVRDHHQADFGSEQTRCLIAPNLNALHVSRGACRLCNGRPPCLSYRQSVEKIPSPEDTRWN